MLVFFFSLFFFVTETFLHGNRLMNACLHLNTVCMVIQRIVCRVLGIWKVAIMDNENLGHSLKCQTRRGMQEAHEETQSETNQLVTSDNEKWVLNFRNIRICVGEGR